MDGWTTTIQICWIGRTITSFVQVWIKHCIFTIWLWMMWEMSMRKIDTQDLTLSIAVSKNWMPFIFHLLVLKLYLGILKAHWFSMTITRIKNAVFCMLIEKGFLLFSGMAILSILGLKIGPSRLLILELWKHLFLFLLIMLRKFVELRLIATI